MHRLLAALVLGLTTTPALAQSPEPPAGLVWMALRDINEHTFDRDDPTNRPPLVTEVPDGMIRATDVNGDGRPDWLVDYQNAEMSAYCGTGGCLKLLYVSQEDGGLIRAFDEQAHELRFYSAGGESRIEAWVHHSLCSTGMSQDCLHAFAWDEASRRLVERPTRDGQGVIAAGAFVPIRAGEDGPPDATPGPVASLWFTTRVTCPSTYNDDGIDIRRAELTDIPDVDGDGVRDWVVEPPSPCQAQPGDEVDYPGFRVWLTRPEGEAVEAYVSPSGRYPNVDVSVSPAIVLNQPPCPFGETCEGSPLRWDAGLGRLVE